ncbi:MAG: pyruvate/2-oxoglutarate dehydrogenase complex dihydrolipoamide acyltransferase (E2) component [Cognaticolwellia sp.]|jgi:pyruvate/2-oxoglutarate dehydrogenase complex dihydrolipoamide acyltransferase (E2) component
MYTFELPEIGEGVVEGEIVQWLVQPGEVIAVDQPVCEIMTDKATVEISSPVGGRIATLHGEPGDVVKVHTPLAEIDSGAGAAAAPVPAPVAAPAPKAAPAAVAAPGAAPAAARPAPVTQAPPGGTPSGGVSSGGTSSGKSVAAPAVRRRAREMDIDLAQVAGSGKGGRVSHDDLDIHGNAPADAVPGAMAPAALPQSRAVPTGAEKHIKIIGLRRKIAEQMVLATQTAPHFTYVEEIDMTVLWDMRKRLKKSAADRGVKLTFLPFFMKALCQVFKEFPNLNSNVIADPFTLVVKGDVNIGIATDTPQGLFVPVVKNVEQKSILQIAAELADVTTRTREGRASAADFSGGTFTITSVGNIGGVLATPILNTPEVAILGVNQIKERPVVIDGEIVIRRMVYFSSSFDHRVIDGAVAARFTTALKNILEHPESMLLELI